MSSPVLWLSAKAELLLPLFLPFLIFYMLPYLLFIQPHRAYTSRLPRFQAFAAHVSF